MFKRKCAECEKLQKDIRDLCYRVAELERREKLAFRKPGNTVDTAYVWTSDAYYHPYVGDVVMQILDHLGLEYCVTPEKAALVPKGKE